MATCAKLGAVRHKGTSAQKVRQRFIYPPRGTALPRRRRKQLYVLSCPFSMRYKPEVRAC